MLNLYIDFIHYKELLKEQDIYNSVQLCDKLLKETGVSILAGKYFGVDDHLLTARFAYVDFDGDFLYNNVDKLTIDNISEYFPNIVKGLQLMFGWICMI